VRVVIASLHLQADFIGTPWHSTRFSAAITIARHTSDGVVWGMAQIDAVGVNEANGAGWRESVAGFVRWSAK